MLMLPLVIVGFHLSKNQPSTLMFADSRYMSFLVYHSITESCMWKVVFRLNLTIPSSITHWFNWGQYLFIPCCLSIDRIIISTIRLHRIKLDNGIKQWTEGCIILRHGCLISFSLYILDMLSTISIVVWFFASVDDGAWLPLQEKDNGENIMARYHILFSADIQSAVHI